MEQFGYFNFSLYLVIFRAEQKKHIFKLLFISERGKTKTFTIAFTFPIPLLHWGLIMTGTQLSKNCLKTTTGDHIRIIMILMFIIVITKNIRNCFKVCAADDQKLENETAANFSSRKMGPKIIKQEKSKCFRIRIPFHISHICCSKNRLAGGH